MIAQLKPLNSADAAMVRKRKTKKKKNIKRKDEEKDDVSKAIDTDRACQAKGKIEGVDDGAIQTKKRKGKGDGPNAIGSDGTRAWPWMYAEDDDTFKVVSTEEVHQLNKFMNEDIIEKTVAYDWGKGRCVVRYFNIGFDNMVDQQRMDPYPEDHPNFGMPGSRRRLIMIKPRPSLRKSCIVSRSDDDKDFWF